MNKNKLSNAIIAALLFCCIVASFLKLRSRYAILRDGVFEKAIVLAREGGKGGVMIKYEFIHKGRKYIRESTTNRNDLAEGDSFFVKIIDNKPKEDIMFFKRKNE